MPAIKPSGAVNRRPGNTLQSFCQAWPQRTTEKFIMVTQDSTVQTFKILLGAKLREALRAELRLLSEEEPRHHTADAVKLHTKPRLSPNSSTRRIGHD
jgi:hypothetical protein